MDCEELNTPTADRISEWSNLVVEKILRVVAVVAVKVKVKVKVKASAIWKMRLPAVLLVML